MRTKLLLVRRFLALGILVGGILSLSDTPLSAQTSNRFGFSKPVLLPEIEGEELVAVPLDPEVYAATQEDFDDVRLLTSDGSEVAYVLRHARDKKSIKEKRTWSPKDISLSPLQNNGLEIVFEVDTEKFPQWPAAIRLSTPLRNFQHRIRLETSEDKENWQELAEDLIFDYSQFMPVRDTEIMLPKKTEAEAASGPKFYRLTIDEVTQEQESQLMELTRNLAGEKETDRSERITINRQPFRIDRIELWNDEYRRDVPTDVEVEYTLQVDRVASDDEKNETTVYIASQSEPLTAIRLETAARNFSRQCRLERLGDLADEGIIVPDESWKYLASERITNIDFRTLKEQRLKIDFSETRVGAYRLVIENGDSQPIPVAGVVGLGPSYEAIFFADPEVSYSLVYSNASLSGPRYDTAAINASLNEGFSPAAAQLGAPTKLEITAEPELPLWKRLLENGLFVTAVIAVLVAVLGVGLYRAAHQLDAP